MLAPRPTPKLEDYHHFQLSKSAYSIYSQLPSILEAVSPMRWTEHVARTGERRGVNLILVGGNLKEKPLGRPRRRWKDNIKMDFQEVGCGVMD